MPEGRQFAFAYSSCCIAHNDGRRAVRNYRKNQHRHTVSVLQTECVGVCRIRRKLFATKQIRLALLDGSLILHRRIFRQRCYLERQDGYAVSTAYMEGIKADRIFGQLCAAEEIGLALVDGSGVLNRRVFERRSYLERQNGYTVSTA